MGDHLSPEHLAGLAEWQTGGPSFPPAPEDDASGRRPSMAKPTGPSASSPALPAAGAGQRPGSPVHSLAAAPPGGLTPISGANVAKPSRTADQRSCRAGHHRSAKLPPRVRAPYEPGRLFRSAKPRSWQAEPRLVLAGAGPGAAWRADPQTARGCRCPDQTLDKPRPRQEGCRSGRTGRSRKPLYARAYRGFESHSLRQCGQYMR